MTAVRLTSAEMVATTGGKLMPEWINFLRECNGTDQGKVFGEPDACYPWWAGGDCEEYPDALVIHRSDGSTSVVSRTQRGRAAIVATAQRLGIVYD